MKALLLFIVLWVAYGLWRSKRRAPPPAQAPRRRIPAPQDMVECAHCGVHLPRPDALPLDGAHYCCAVHRAAGPR
ncbi:MAG: PP0621 family protein [Acidovorax sp.]